MELGCKNRLRRFFLFLQVTKLVPASQPLHFLFPHLNLRCSFPRCIQCHPSRRVSPSEFITILSSYPGGSDGKEFACNAGDLGSIPGSGRSPGEGNGNSLQYSCLENSLARENHCQASHTAFELPQKRFNPYADAFR